MFPIDKFSAVKAELVVDSRAPAARLYRYKSAGTLTPYYRFTLTSPPLEYREAMAVDATLDSYHGNLVNFPLQNPLPQIKSRTGLFLYVTASKGDSQITVGGFPSNEVDAAVAGDFLKITGSQKSYRILSDATANASGQCVIKLTQPLIQAYSAPAVIDYGADVVFQVCMEDRDSGEVSVQNNKFVVHDVELIEQI
tara:strand:+ start:2555 stop:3142 length:588 start_codon:yes stop_codon:yes gene_type:complete